MNPRCSGENANRCCCPSRGQTACIYLFEGHQPRPAAADGGMTARSRVGGSRDRRTGATFSKFFPGEKSCGPRRSSQGRQPEASGFARAPFLAAPRVFTSSATRRARLDQEPIWPSRSRWTRNSLRAVVPISSGLGSLASSLKTATEAQNPVPLPVSKTSSLNFAEATRFRDDGLTSVDVAETRKIHWL